jgi:twinkle protein
MRGIVGLHLNKRINLHGADYTASEIDAAYDDLELDNRIALWDHWGSTNIDNVISRLKFFVKAMDCPIVILDHLSIVIRRSTS